MGRALILDSEAVSALAHGPPRRQREVLAAIMAARNRRAGVVVPAAVLVEVYRGRRQDAGIDSLLSRHAFGDVPVDRRLGRVAGGILGTHSDGSEHAVDACVVATAAIVGGGIVLTHDPADMMRLAEGLTFVTVVALA